MEKFWSYIFGDGQLDILNEAQGQNEKAFKDSELVPFERTLKIFYQNLTYKG